MTSFIGRNIDFYWIFAYLGLVLVLPKFQFLRVWGPVPCEQIRLGVGLIWLGVDFGCCLVWVRVLLV